MSKPTAADAMNTARLVIVELKKELIRVNAENTRLKQVVAFVNPEHECLKH